MKHSGYEYLLNSIYCFGVIENHGVNAEVYQKMHEEYNNLNLYAAQVKVYSAYAFRRSFLIVANYVQQAIKDGINNFQFKMQSADVTKLTYMVAMLNRNFFDKQSLDLIIATANSVFSQYSLKN